MLTALAHVPASISSAVGVTSPDDPTTAPTATGNASLWQSPASGAGARPVVFFYGAEFAPYAAAERWPVIVALSRFGTFDALGLMQSSSSVAFSDTPTFTFWHANYTSVWVDLQTVERYSALNPTGAGYTPLQTPTARQAASVSIYDTSATTFPLLDIANHYVLVGSSFSPSVLDGLSQAQIIADLAIPASPVTQAIMASANEITAAICTVTGQRPAAVCGAHGVVRRTPKWASPRLAEDDPSRPAPGRVRGGTGGVPQLARRSSTILRSTSFRPPQIPCGSRIRMAYSRQSPRT